MSELITKSFAAQCLAFPDKVDQALAEITTVHGAKDLLDKAGAMQTYAKRLKVGVDAERPIAIGVLKIKAKLGELMPREKGGRGKKNSTGTPLGFHSDTIAAYRKLADNKERLAEYFDYIFETVADIPSERGFIRFCGADSVIASKHGNDVIEWYTPGDYIESARRVMGSIDCDPATSEHAQTIVCAEVYFTATDDGLSQDWNGNVFLNPPFKHPLVERFVFKLCDEVKKKTVRQAILLTNNNTDTAWWHRAAEQSASVCFTKGRIRFYNAAGEWSSPTNGQTFMYFGNRRKAFLSEFRQWGLVLGMD